MEIFHSLQIDPAFENGEPNAVVKGWLINSMDPKLVKNFIRFSTAKAVWDNIAITYFDGTDTSQEDRVYTFLDGLDDRLDKIRADVLQIQPFPTNGTSLCTSSREDLRQSVMMMNEDTISGGAMLSRGGHKPQHQLSFQSPSNGKPNTTTKPKGKEEAAHIVGMQNTPKKHASNYMVIQIAEPQLSLVPQQESSISTSEQAIDHMTFDPCDFLKPPNQNEYEIIGRGTKREGLYYMDDFSYVKERHIWLWHNRLGHPHFVFEIYFQEHGLHHETSCSQTPQQNGVAERKNRHILEITRALLTAAYVPKRFGDAMNAVYLMNRLPSRVLHYKTPLQVLAQHVTLPSVLMLPPRKFGCVTYVHLHKNQRTKLDPCVVRCVFLGYAAHKKGYRCYDPATRRLYTTMDVTFIESRISSLLNLPTPFFVGDDK
ncbi:hypothetical protein AAG906_015256 [Vitis piasezkii]